MSAAFPNAKRPAPVEVGEAARLDTLQALGLLDAASEGFDRATRVASRALGVPVSLVSFVGADRQVFGGRTGLSGPFAEACETPMSHSFCQHVVRMQAPLVVTDARQHPDLCDNLAIRDLDVVAYLGVPLHSPDGQVLGSLCVIEHGPQSWSNDELALLEDVARGVDAEIALRAETVRHRETARELETTNDRLGHILESTSDGIVFVDAHWRIMFANRRFAELTELDEPPTGRTLWDLFPEAVGNDFWRDYHAALEGSEPHRVTAYYPPLERWFEADATPSADGLTIFFRDITARHDAEAARQLMIRELHHRIKNLFAIVSGLIAMTARRTGTPGEMATSLRQRLHSLARAHELIRPAVTLEASHVAEITLQKLLVTILEPHLQGDAARVALDGPSIHLGPNTTTSFALVLHEIATNAAKYGALSTPEGRLAIRWSLEDGTFRLRWREHGGPTLAGAPHQTGFGAQLVNMSVCTQMAGKVRYAWNRTGVVIDIDIPEQQLAH